MPYRKPVPASRPMSPTKRQKQENHYPTACPQHARPRPKTSWALALPTSRLTQALRHPGPHTQLYQERSFPTSDMTATLGSLDSITRFQDPVLTGSSPVLTPGLGYTHQWSSNRFGVFWTLSLQTGEPAEAPGPLGVTQSASS